VKEENIVEILDRLNSGPCDDVIITEIGRATWWGYVWGPTIYGYACPDYVQHTGHEFFFVKADAKNFAAAVLFMGPNELHWLVLPRYRGKGILVEPLKRVILPFIFKRNENQPNQMATLDLKLPHAKHSARLAEKVGFQRMDETDTQYIYRIDRAAVPQYKQHRRPKITAEQAAQLETEIDAGIRSLGMTLDTIRVKHSHPFQNELAEDAFNRLQDARRELHDALQIGAIDPSHNATD